MHAGRTTRFGAVATLATSLLVLAGCEPSTFSPTQPAEALTRTAAVAAATSPNLIANPGLETTGTGGNPANWSRVNWGTFTPTYTYPVAGNSSTRAARVRYLLSSSGGAGYRPDAVPVTPGVTYNYSEFYNSDVASQLDVEWTSSTGAVSYGWVANVASSNRAWKPLTASIVVPAGMTKVRVFHFISKAGSLTIDNVSLTSATVVPPPPTPTATLLASPSIIAAGQSATLAWSSSNSTACTASGGWTGTQAVSGSLVVSPSVTTTYTLTCTGAGGSATSSTVVTVTTTPPPPTSTTFAQGMVTISLDDSWASQYSNALPILQAAGLKATFYLCSTPLQESWQGFMTAAQAQDIGAKGHEIAGHSMTHPDLTTLTQAQVDNEVQTSRSYLQTLTGQAVTTFAYPYGARNALVKSRIAPAGYTSGRTVDLPGFNDPTTDKYELKSITLLSTQSLADITSQIDLAIANKRWLILTGHEVNVGGDIYFITPTRFQEIVNYIKQSGIKVVTIAQGRALMP